MFQKFTTFGVFVITLDSDKLGLKSCCNRFVKYVRVFHVIFTVVLSVKIRNSKKVSKVRHALPSHLVPISWVPFSIINPFPKTIHLADYEYSVRLLSEYFFINFSEGF
jgi:hypothetical protein